MDKEEYNSIMYFVEVEYSETSDEAHIGGQYKFTCFVPCREVILFSEVQIVLLL